MKGVGRSYPRRPSLRSLAAQKGQIMSPIMVRRGNSTIKKKKKRRSILSRLSQHLGHLPRMQPTSTKE
jgi:hypothetical protein